MLRILACCLGACWLSIGTPQTLAHNGPTNVSSSRILIGDWMFVPIYTRDDDQTIDIVSFLAVLDGRRVNGDNITSIWYLAEPGGWGSYAWTSQDPRIAAESIKDALQIPNTQDRKWGFPPTVNETFHEPVLPISYENGFFADDPILDTVENFPDRDAVVSVLVKSGYPAANVGVEWAASCTTAVRLDAISQVAIHLIESGDDAFTIVDDAEDLCNFVSAGPLGPPPVRPPKPTTAPPWSPPGTVPTAPAWTPGGWPAGPAWSCRTVPLGGGGSNCICSRRQQWGRWESTSCWIFFTCIKWHVIIEHEVCTDINTPCPAGGPPPASASCTTTYR